MYELHASLAGCPLPIFYFQSKGCCKMLEKRTEQACGNRVSSLNKMVVAKIYL